MKHCTHLPVILAQGPGQSSLYVPIVVYVRPNGAPNKTVFCKRKKRAGFGTSVGVQFEMLAGEGSWRPRSGVWAGFGTVNVSAAANTVVFYP